MIIYDKSGSKKYPYRVLTEYSYYVGGFPDMQSEYFDIKDGILTLKKDYCSDGVTAWFDFPGLMSGAFVHDALLQGIDLELIPEFFRDRTHDVFYRECIKNNWFQKRSAGIAYRGLKLLHKPFHRLMS